VLLLLWEADPRTVKELGEALHLDYGTMSPLLKRLEAHELIVRARSGRDERTVLISLTARGRDLRDPVAHVQSAVACTLAMDPARHADLLRTLHSLAHTARTAPVAATPSPPVAQRSADPAG
jgi:DNA-binding MarR family transcriptional regulator